MQNNLDDEFVANEMRRLYSLKEEGLDEFKIGNHKSGGCSICYDGGVQAIKSYKGGVKIYKKEDPNDKIHIDIDSHNVNSSSSESESDSESDSNKKSKKMKGGNYERKIGGQKLVDKMQLPSSSMAGGKKKLNSKMKKRMKKIKEIMKERGVNMIEASKIIKKEEIKY